MTSNSLLLIANKLVLAYSAIDIYHGLDPYYYPFVFRLLQEKKKKREEEEVVVVVVVVVYFVSSNNSEM